MRLARAISSRRAANRGRLTIALLALLFCTAPTPGDVGGCGQKAAPLDAQVFFASKQAIDCDQCRACGLTSSSCTNACQVAGGYPTSFPDRCEPLVHDGEVCLRALEYAGCDAYASYMNDSTPSVPTECNFCPEPAP